GAETGAGNGQRLENYRSLFDTEPAAGKTTLRPAYDYMQFDGKMTSHRNEERGRRSVAMQKEPEEAKIKTD
ncbi:MAG: hypothetical protein AAF525_08580, partial [Pseudomonadota bacterium]